MKMIRPAPRSILMLFAPLLLLMAGCAQYEFDVAQPVDHRAHVGTKDDLIVQLDPLQYRFRSVEGRLVVRVYNPTPDAIQLLGERSYVVAPDGQSRPLKPMAIAPGSFIKIILPPVRPVSYRTGPSFGIGVGTTVGRRHGDGFGGVGYEDEPVYAYTEDDGGIVYWDWDGEGEARVTLVYQRGNAGTFEDKWVFARKKMP